MFCDLVGSTALAGDLDPEELRAVIRAYQSVCGEVVSRFQGHIAQYLGDGLLIYFGYPVAHEDDAQRAVHTALGMIESLGQLNTRLAREQNLTLAVRVGIHTGLVVVGEIGSGAKQEHLALGETPNMAARLQALADPDTVMISATTYRLVRGFFACRDLGPRTLKGVSMPVQTYQVLAGTPVRSRFEVAGASALTPLVGREQEVGLLLERWEQVMDGFGHVVVLSGEPGIGKSRLVQVVKGCIADTPRAALEGRCSPYYHPSPLYAVIDLLQQAAQWKWDDGVEERLGALERMLDADGLSRHEMMPLMAPLLSLPLPDHYTPLALSSERQKQRTLEAVLALLFAMAARHPLLVVIEDLHWVDPSTVEFLDLLLEQIPTARVLLLLTTRPEFRLPWASRSHLAHLTLNRLSRRQTEVMARRIATGKEVPIEVLQRVVTQTDGVPLFVEELTKTVLESGFAFAIPATLHDSLMARLDRLGTAKDLAQLGSTIGRAFPYKLVRAVSPLTEATLQDGLARLVQAELLYQRGRPPHAVYIFKHALIQEAAYQSLLKSTRQLYHEKVARVLAEKFPEMAETEPELLAHHYTEAGGHDEAIVYWRKAGQRALERSANREAIEHLTKGLRAIKQLPPAPERLRPELDVLTALGPALMAVKGFGSPEVAEVYARARALCRDLGTTPELFTVLRGLWEFYEIQADLRTGGELAEEILELAERTQDNTLLLIAHDVMGDTSLWSGKFAETRAHMEQGLALHDPTQHRSLAFRYGGYDPAMACRAFGGHALWYLGYPDEGLKRSQEALALARELSHPPTLVFAMSHAALLLQFRGEAQQAFEKAEAAIALSTEHGFAFWLAHATIPLGWALVHLGRGREGIGKIQEGLAGYRATGAELERSLWLALLAEAHARLDQPEDGLLVVEEGLAHVATTGVRFHEAELYRLKGELLLMKAPPSVGEAEHCFQRALEVARKQSARSLELRAMTSLSRLWAVSTKADESHRALTRIFDWFTEGFDTRDLKDARAILAHR